MENKKRKKRSRQRICKNCNELYRPDYKNLYHQHYCNKPECRYASKKDSHRKWLASDKGAGYFKGARNVNHVKEWRKTHPGYWKSRSKKKNALQDNCSSQHDKKQVDSNDLKKSALQDICSSQLPLLLGLISNLIGSTLQDNIVESTEKFIHLGYDILGMSSNQNEKGSQNDYKKSNLSRANPDDT